MDDHFSIGQISELIGIPKSTLRYWDSEGLIKLSRNNANNYREYSLSVLYDIGDIAFFRSLHMTIQELKDLYSFDREQLTNLLTEKEQQIEQEIQQLSSTLQKIQAKKLIIGEYQSLIDNPYKPDRLDVTHVIPFPYQEKYAWQLCFKDPYQYMLYIKKDSMSIQNIISIDSFIGEGNIELTSFNDTSNLSTQFESSSLALKKEISDPSIKLNINQKYVTFLLKITNQTHIISNLKEHRSILESQGFTTGDLIARFLFTEAEDEPIDYFKAWIAISKD